MKVDYIKYYNTAKQFVSKNASKAWNKLPNVAIKDSTNIVNKLDSWTNSISSPTKNKLIVGTSAILTQPVIDYYNHRVDEETRTVSRNRTFAKALVGTAVGLAVRKGAYDMVKAMTQSNGVAKYSKWLLPKSIKISNLTKYQNTIANLIALGMVAVTNVLLDAPLTTWLSNKINKSFPPKNKQVNEGGNNA